jgi:ABC-2 type transport system permease protein
MSFFSEPLDLYRTLGRVSIAVQLQYRASGVIWMIGSVLEPTIYLVVWSTVARGQGGSAGGYAPEDFAAYFLVQMFVSHLTFSWIMHEFQYRIQQGDFNMLLLRPVHPIHGDVADNLAYKLVMLVVMLPAAVALALLFRPRFDVEPWAAALFVPALVLAFAVRFLCEWSLALAAFWTTRTSAVNQTYFALHAFLSGRVAPMALLPGVLQTSAGLLPFYWMIAFPVELLLGRLTPAEAWRGLAFQALWVAAALALLSALWRIAVRRYSAVGA